MREVIKEQILNCKNVETALRRAEKHLIRYSKGNDYQSQMKVVYAVQQFSNRMANLSMIELQYI